MISAGQGSAIQSLSKDEKKMSEMLNDMISLNVNDKDGYVQLFASLGEPLAVAQLAERAQDLYYGFQNREGEVKFDIRGATI